MSTHAAEYRGDLIAALNRLGIPESEHHRFWLSADEQFVHIDGPRYGLEIDLGDAARVGEGGMSVGIERKLRAAGVALSQLPIQTRI